MTKGNNKIYTDSDYLKFWAMMSCNRIIACLESCKTPGHLIACDRLVSLFRKSYLQAANYEVCNTELQCALQNARIDIQYMAIHPTETFIRFLR